MFKPVSSRVSFPEMDARILDFWKKEDIFRRSESERAAGPLFMLFEGPPTANGSPGIHHVLARVFKDVICRHRTMKGFRCIRKGGWDTHGLPVELEIEKELGLTSKREIEEYGIEKFNAQCRDSVFRYVKDWEVLTDRIGFWVDMDDPYVTLENDYIESGWWIIKQLWDKGLVYQGLRGTPHCPRCETSLSSHEVALGYKDDTPDPSVFPKFRINGYDSAVRRRDAFDASFDQLTSFDGPVYLLAWTTTPWTLPGNTALAVDAAAEYSIVKIQGVNSNEYLVVAAALVQSAVQGEYSVVGSIEGRALVGLTYEPLYDPLEYNANIRRFVEQAGEEGGSGTVLEPSESFQPRVVDAGFVSMEDGTGIVHIAPAFGDEDLNLGRSRLLSFVQEVDLRGVVTGSYPFAGKFVKDADPLIMADLEERGLLHHKATYRHTYPFCWRCDTPLLYYAKSSWYIRTTAVKDRLVSGNDAINWYPGYIKDGRFGEWLRNNIDWAISRERYWGTPIPIWECPDCRRQVCMGSVSELEKHASGGSRSSVTGLDLHRPFVDDITLDCPAEGCSGIMRRIPEVMDAWFDSGAMPYAQWHYPFDNPGMDDDGRFPADYICEAVDQTRGWFYSLHALGTLLKDQPAYDNVICLGLILDDRGRKMSKRIGNVVDPNTVLDATGADALRWYLFTASHPGEPRRFSDRLVNETLRRVLLTLWNVYSFFTNYANIDGFTPDQIPADWTPENELDRWILSELNLLITQVDDHLENYSPTDAGRRIQEFIDGLSNWYVRRSRRRFWRSENDGDKLSAHATLYQCLVTVAKLMAPLAPFMADEIYQNLVSAADPDAPASVHLAAFPVADNSLVDARLMDATRLAMRVSSMGRAARSRAGLKVRQPLPAIVVKTRLEEEEQYLEWVESQVLEELNVKALRGVSHQPGLFQEARAAAGENADAILSIGGYSVNLEAGYMVALDATVTPELAQEGLAREVAHRIQNLRRAAGFDITDRIVTYYEGPDELAAVMQAHAGYIGGETLSDDLCQSPPPDGAHSETQQVEGMEITLAVRRA